MIIHNHQSKMAANNNSALNITSASSVILFGKEDESRFIKE